MTKNIVTPTLIIQIASMLTIMCPELGASEEIKDDQKSAVSIPLGGFKLSPVFEIGETYNDNIFQRNLNQKGSLITQIHAGMEWAMEHHFNRYALTYVMQSSQYHQSAQDDYIDHYVGLDTHTEFTKRNRLDVNLKYLDSHYQRGYFLGRDLFGPTTPINDPDQFHSYTADGRYRYGQATAKGNLELLANISDIHFDNNPERTEQQSRQLISITPGFYYRLTGKTHLHSQMENNWVQHQQLQASAFDTYKQRYLLGATWDYSKVTQLIGRAGYLHLTYDNTNLNTYDDITWDLSVRWAPLSYSMLNLSVSRDVMPNIASSNLRAGDRFRLSWTHDWSTRISTQINTSYEKAENLGINRQDNYNSVGFDINYGVQRWLGVGINYNYRSLQSSDETIDFDQNAVLFYITGNPRLSDNIKSPWNSWY